MVPPAFLESFDIAKLLLFFHGWFHGLLGYLLSWLGGVYHQLIVLFYCLPDQVFDVGGAPVSAAKADSSSPELVRDTTSSSVSLVEMLTTLL